MTAPAPTARPGQPVSDVARLMVHHEINRSPLVSEGRLVGIVSRADLVRAFHRPDEELEREIRAEVLWDIFLLASEAFRLTVEGGVVTIRGPCGRLPTPRASRAVCGVYPAPSR